MFKLFKFKTKGVKKSKDVYQSYKESHQSERDYSEPVGIIVNRWSGKLKKKYGI